MSACVHLIHWMFNTHTTQFACLHTENLSEPHISTESTPKWPYHPSNPISSSAHIQDIHPSIRLSRRALFYLLPPTPINDPTPHLSLALLFIYLFIYRLHPGRIFHNNKRPCLLFPFFSAELQALLPIRRPLYYSRCTCLINSFLLRPLIIVNNSRVR